MAKTIVNNNIKLKSGGGIITGTNGLELSIIPAANLVNETITTGDFLKLVNRSSVYKVEKIVGVNAAVTQSGITKAGDILKVKQLSATRLVILTSTKLYLADWNGTNLTNLVDITTATAPMDFDILSETKIVSARFTSSNSSTAGFRKAHCTIIDVSGNPSFGSEEVWTINLNYASLSGYNVCALAADKFLVQMGGTDGSYVAFKGEACAASVSGTAITFGTPLCYADINNTYEDLKYNSMFSFKVVDSTHIGLAYQYKDSGSNVANVNFILFKVIGTTVTATAQTIGTRNSVDAKVNVDFAMDTDGKIQVIYYYQESKSFRRVGTVSGDSVTFSSEVELATNYAVNQVECFQNYVYLRVGTTVYTLSITPTLNTVFETETITEMYAMTTGVIDDKFFLAISNDANPKTVKFLLDRRDFIGIADKNYAISDNYLIVNFWLYTGLVQGLDYYVSKDGQSLSLTSTYQKIGRAINDTTILK